MKRIQLLFCCAAALHVIVFLPIIVQAEMPIEVRIISTPYDSIDASRTSSQPEARFAFNRLSGNAEACAGHMQREFACLLRANSVPVPATAVLLSEDANGPITKTSFNILAVAQTDIPQRRPVYVIIALPAEVDGELSIQYISSTVPSAGQNLDGARQPLAGPNPHPKTVSSKLH